MCTVYVFIIIKNEFDLRWHCHLAAAGPPYNFTVFCVGTNTTVLNLTGAQPTSSAAEFSLPSSRPFADPSSAKPPAITSHVTTTQPTGIQQPPPPAFSFRPRIPADTRPAFDQTQPPTQPVFGAPIASFGKPKDAVNLPPTQTSASHFSSAVPTESALRAANGTQLPSIAATTTSRDFNLGPPMSQSTPATKTAASQLRFDSAAANATTAKTVSALPPTVAKPSAAGTTSGSTVPGDLVH